MPYEENKEYFKGRGAQVNTHNRFQKNKYITEHIEGLDEEYHENTPTQFFEEDAKSIISVAESPDISFLYSINPYQGCEHGCLYCYARNIHEYWGFSAGLDFERKIVVKRNAAKLLEQQFNKPNYVPVPIMMSGNTDCYQPIERKLKITRSLLEVFLKYKHPVSIISKNNLVWRDIDLIRELAALNLVHVTVTINSLNENLRQKMEPRTVTAKSRLMLINKLASENIPVRLMMAPIVPGLNSEEIPALIKAAADEGVSSAIFTIIRLNGAIGEIFSDWIHKAYPDRAEKVLNRIADCHGGSLNDSRIGKRIRGDGKIAESIHQLFNISVNRFLKGRSMPPLSTDHFMPAGGKQLNIF
ncbi:PA0069 family radical SAM protein [Pedobacter sp. SYSU D00535]|uniref:PA0069 family radical SAM protein n=1 Tax=Pedobacter sp. SYSU D00535 TaxID=2810308 RepID=UPI001A968C0E|nr:PA0069 family radical SAM protein [Pedobacter sp. SYSU D00535]